ncbi:toxin-antitoxin system HicB family antitoxin [Rhizobium herbae]|uniref:Toxin-antitoxin system HicB family antitoxin n=1 Tax=Rhizobium herbae TaxID=508661 RepID=A0ABS7H829_9HYPH|nr:toxin-antitoxin system HicB family antitoxin [Rhizobium herbae]MBW9063397.1 toxin-antitoxin system HicB family antitoxin [Rhizobium herbae]
MSTLTIRIPNDEHERLKALAAARGISLNTLFEELSERALAEFDAETRFRPDRGSERRRLVVLDHLDRAHRG